MVIRIVSGVFGREKAIERKCNCGLRLIRVRKRAEQARRSTVIHQPLTRGDRFGLEGLDFRPVHPHHQQACHEGAEDLGEDVVWDFPPGEPLPDGEADGDGRVEVAAGGGGGSDDGEGDAQGEGPADLEEVAEGGDANGVFEVEGEGGDGGDAGEAVKVSEGVYFGKEVARGFADT